MKTQTDNNTLTLFLEGRIDSGNAPDVEKEIFAAAETGMGRTVIIDAGQLEYISSAGLRVLMKLRKQSQEPLAIQNVSPGVYEIFDTTGFTELFNVRKKLHEISIDGCEQIGAGVSSKVYRIDRDTIVKVYQPQIGLDRIEEERENAKTAFVNGIPTAITFDIVKCGDSYGTVYELIDAVQLSKFLLDHPGKAPEYRAKYAKMIKEMHGIKLPEKFRDLKESCKNLLGRLQSMLYPEELDALYRLVDAIPDRDTFVHCDAHIGNTMVQDGELILIDMADVGRGHPFFDLGMLCYHYQIVPNSPNPQGRSFGLQTILGFVPETNDFLDALWKDFINVYFEPQSENDFMMINGIARVAGGLQAVMTPARQTQLEEKYKKMGMEAIRKNFLPKLAEYTELVRHMDIYF